MTVVAVTGAAGYLGRRLCEELEKREDVRRVVGIDTAEPGFSTRNLEFYNLDTRSAELREVIAGCDVLYHLAFVLMPMRDVEEMRDLNVGGTRNVLAAASAAGVRKVVFVSSGMAYGAHPDNDFPLTEDSPIRPVREFAYSAHKAECEEILSGFRDSYPDVTVTVFRPAFVMGPTVSGVVARLVESPTSLALKGYDPPGQVVHETDASRALVFALDHDLNGAYNLCADGWIDRDRSAELLGKRRVTLSYEDAHRRLERMWRIGISDLPPTYLAFVMYPWVMSNARLQEAGFRFLHGNEETLAAAAEARRGWVSVGRVRFRPTRVAASVLGVGIVAGSLVRRLRRRGRDS